MHDDFTPEPFKIKMVEPIRASTRDERLVWLTEGGYNLAALQSDQVYIDMLTDSGVTAMSDRQWAGLMLGDESYAGSRNFARLASTVWDIFGYEHVLPAHQGRAAEHVLFRTLLKPGDVTLSNLHFDTTRANLEDLGVTAIDLPNLAAYDIDDHGAFKGDIDLGALQDRLDHYQGKVKMLIMTMTSNDLGGHPVSLANLREARAITQTYGVPLMIDACRFAENAWFIHEREAGYRHTPVAAIVREIFSLADGCTMSGKKDGLVNMGGFVALRSAELAERVAPNVVLREGYITYGGINGRDLEAMAIGLEEAIDDRYLEYRTGQAAYLHGLLRTKGLPVIQPAGGHGVFLDVERFVPHLAPERFPGRSLLAAMYLAGGIRAGEMIVPGMPAARTDWSLIRLAIPRRVYSHRHLAYVAKVIVALHERRADIPGLRETYATTLMGGHANRYTLADMV